MASNASASQLLVVLASNLGWSNVPLKERLEQELDGLCVEVDKDTNAAALAEARLGARRAFRHFLYATAGTGSGSEVVRAGKAYTDQAECELRRRVLPALNKVVRLVPLGLGHDVGVAGAALLLAESKTEKNGGSA